MNENGVATGRKTPRFEYRQDGAVIATVWRHAHGATVQWHGRHAVEHGDAYEVRSLAHAFDYVERAYSAT